MLIENEQNQSSVQGIRLFLEMTLTIHTKIYIMQLFYVLLAIETFL